jgi:hypothetical protein
MILLFSLLDKKGEVLFQTWDRTTADMLRMYNSNFYGYTYTSNRLPESVARIANNQQMTDYHRYLQQQCRKG